MKYVARNEFGYYKFYRKIPNSQKQFIFSLKTKNAKLAKKIVSSFLIKSTQYFIYLQNLSKEEIVNRLEEIQAILENYRDEALKEYTELEMKRHAHFTYEKRDGAHPESLKHWIAELQEHIVSNRTQKQTQELIRQILKRSTMPLKTFYQSITDQNEKVRFMQLLIKSEVHILKTDYERAKEYFDLDYHLEKNNTKNIQDIVIKAINEKIETVSISDYQNDKSVIDKAKYKTKNKSSILEEYMGTFSVMKKADKDKVIFPIQTLLQSSDSEFLIDYDEDDYDLFMFSLAYTPSRITILKKIFESQKYNRDFISIARDFANDTLNPEGYEIEFQTKKTLEEKLAAVKAFLKFCVNPKRNYLDINILETDDPDLKHKYTNIYFDDIAKESQTRTPFRQEELESMFEKMIENNFFKSKNIAHFYIPMVGLLSGMRLEEICKLKIEDIVIEDKIYCFSVTPPAKTKSSIRKVPIHSYLINELNILDYVKSRTGKDYLFDLKRVEVKGKLKHSHEYGQEFGIFRENFVSEKRRDEDLVSFHSFRHTFSTRLNAGRVQDNNISRLLGHIVKKTNETGRYVQPEYKTMKEDIELMNLRDLKFQLKRLSINFKKSVKF